MMSSIDKNNSDFTIQNILSSGKNLSESNKFINFTVQNTAGEIVSINVNRKETVENLQARIQNQCGIPLNEQILSCFGESTLLNGNDGMQQTFNDLNEIRANVNEMEHDLKNKFDKAQQRIYELQAKMAENETKNNRINSEINDETNAQIVEQKHLVQKSEKFFKISNQITDLTNGNAEFIDQSRIRTIKDVLLDFEIDYQLLNGKILKSNRLKYCGYERKWVADDIGISFENSDFLVYPKELDVDSHSNFSENILKRIVCNNLKELYLHKTTITYSDYMKLTSSQKLDHLELRRVTVMDENGRKVEIDKLLKEKKYVKDLTYQFNDGEATSETAQKLAQLPPFPNFQAFYLSNVQEGFDLKTFGDFLKKNPTITFCGLWYKCSTKFYEEIKQAQNDLLPTLPSTFKLDVYKFV